MKNVSIFILICVLLALVRMVASAQVKLPRVLNPGDTAIATSPAWVQSLDSEVDQRIEAKQLKEKLEAYVKKTGEIEALQAVINQKEAEKDKLLKEGSAMYETTISKLSDEITSCNNDLVKLYDQKTKLEKKLKRSDNAKKFWRAGAVGQALIIAGTILLTIL